QNSLDNAHSRSIGRLNHIPAAIETLSMGPGPKQTIDGIATVHALAVKTLKHVASYFDIANGTFKNILYRGCDLPRDDPTRFGGTPLGRHIQDKAGRYRPSANEQRDSNSSTLAHYGRESLLFGFFIQHGT
ncbi:MAG: hypothetical protein K2X73_13305, partial [Sphingomonas sp.]|uniref:hypothetical protein n=1 Tax=Sphingomonas sp. TaxID=28214 RepID=UPI0025FDB693